MQRKDNIQRQDHGCANPKSVYIFPHKESSHMNSLFLSLSLLGGLKDVFSYKASSLSLSAQIHIYEVRKQSHMIIWETRFWHVDNHLIAPLFYIDQSGLSRLSDRCRSFFDYHFKFTFQKSYRLTFSMNNFINMDKGSELTDYRYILGN